LLEVKLAGNQTKKYLGADSLEKGGA